MGPLWPKPITAPATGWTAFPSSRRPSYPRHRGNLQTEVAIIGGGALGCATAYVLAAAGIDVAIFEQGRLAHAQAGRATGIVVHEPEPFFHELAKQHGVRDARHIYQIARRGSLEYVSALKRLRIECGLQIRDAIHFSSSPDGIHALQKEYSARREAGLDVASMKGTPLFRADRRERLRPCDAWQCERRSVQSDARACARGRGARREDLRAVAGHAHPPTAPDRRHQDGRWCRDGVQGRRGDRISDRRLQAAAPPIHAQRRVRRAHRQSCLRRCGAR